MAFVSSYLDDMKTVLVNVAPAMPPEAWWATACIVWILSLAALIDAHTEEVPDILIFFGLLAVTLVQGLYLSWDDAAHRLRQAIGAGVLIWAINFAWFAKFRYDALGMGDAKWTMLAVACFGIVPAILAWGVGSVLATIFIGGARVFRRQIRQVTFSPFLLIGLSVALFFERVF